MNDERNKKQHIGIMFVIMFVNSSYKKVICVNKFESFSTLYLKGRRHMYARIMTQSVFCDMTDNCLWIVFSIFNDMELLHSLC